MAESTDMQRLVVSMEARFTTFTKELQKVTSSVDGEAKKIERRFKTVNDNLVGQTSNLAAQFNDIGVQLASGTSPLTVALQQGTQISQVLGETKGGAAGAVKALGAAFASVVSPISLATIGIIALGGAAIQYIGSAIGEVESLDDHLKAHSELIKRIKDAYGEAAEGLEQYARESTAVLETQTRASIIKLQADLERLSKTIARSLTESPRLLPTNPTAGIMEVDTDSLDRAVSKYDAFAAAIRRLKDEAGKGEPNIRAFRDAVSAIAQANPGDKEIQKLANELLEMSKQAYEIEGALATARRAIGLIGDVASGQVGQIKELTKALDELGRIGMPNLTDRERALEAYNKAIGAAGGSEDRRSAQLAYDAALKRIGEREAEEAAEKARREAERASKRKPKEDPYNREIDEIQEATRALELEFETRGKSNVEREKARTIMEVENALRREGRSLSEGERADVEQLAEAYAQMSEKLKAANAAQAELQNLASSTMKGFVSDLMRGVSAADALQDALERVADKMVDLAINSLFDTKGGGGLGGLLAGLFKFEPLGPALASGGMVRGPGSGTSDSITARLSNGEYVVNAKATAQHRDLLDAINSGGLPAFASGGIVGVPEATGRRPLAEGSSVFVNIINNTDAKVTQKSTKTAGGTQLDVVIDQIAAQKMGTPGTASNRALRTYGGGMPLTRR